MKAARDTVPLLGASLRTNDARPTIVVQADHVDAVRAVVYHPTPRRQDALLRDQDLWPLGDRHELLRTGFVLLVLVIDDRRICVQAETLNLHHLLGKTLTRYPRDTADLSHLLGIFTRQNGVM